MGFGWPGDEVAQIYPPAQTFQSGFVRNAFHLSQ